MPYRHEIMGGSSFARVVGWGDTDHAESVAALRKVVADPQFRTGLGLLVDLRGLTTVPTPDEARAFTTELTRVIPKRVSRLGLVMKDAPAFGMGRMLATLMRLQTGVDVSVFKEIEPAELWMTRR